MRRLDRLAWAGRVTLDVGSGPVTIRSTSPLLLELVTGALRSHVISPADDHVEDPLFAMAITEPGAARVGRPIQILYRGTWDLVRSSSARSVFDGLIAELEAMRGPRREDVTIMEAGLVRTGGRHVLLPSSLVPAMGQLSRRAARQGLDIELPVSMVVGVDEVGRVVPIPPTVEVDHRIVAEIDRAFPAVPDRYACGGPVGIDVMLCLGTGIAGVVDVSRAQALHAFAAGAMNLQPRGRRGLTSLGLLAARARCLAYGWGSPWELCNVVAAAGDDASAGERDYARA